MVRCSSTSEFGSKTGKELHNRVFFSIHTITGLALRIVLLHASAIRIRADRRQTLKSTVLAYTMDL